MDKLLASRMPWPEWALPGCHYYEQTVNEKWLKGKQYDHLRFAFCEETDGNTILKHYEKRPSVRLQLPSLCSDYVSRKLFATSHAPVPKHQKPKVLEAVKWLIKTAKLNKRMMEATYFGQSGSVALIPKVVNGLPVVRVWNASMCLAAFQENCELDNLKLAQLVLGMHFKTLKNPISTDVDGEALKPDGVYWYVREWNTRISAATYAPIPEGHWNPEDGPNDKLRLLTKDLEPNFVKDRPSALWLRNLDGGDNFDGRATFETVKSTCVDLDYNLSQMGRGLKYASAPTPIIKGRILNMDRGSASINMGPASAINIPADKKEGPNIETSGADVKLLEMRADAIQHGMESFVSKVKMWTQEVMAMGRKDPDTIRGDLSGTAMKLLDGDMIDLVQAQQSTYGDEGLLILIVILGSILIALGHEKFSGVTIDDLNEIELEWPTLYEPTPQEQLQLSQAIDTALKAGIQNKDEGRRMWETQVGRTSDMIQAIQDEISDTSEDTTPGSDVSAGDAAPAQGKELGKTIAGSGNAK